MQTFFTKFLVTGSVHTPRLTATLLFAVLLCGAAVTSSSAAPAHTQGTSAALAPRDFGHPPSGEIPILYNDHTVYTTPDLLTKMRVLAAFVKDGQIYVPLRSMFEQMGATVMVSPDGKTVTATKPGVSVSVKLGKHQVVINGETRRLDVPPMLYKGVMLVPVRVLSEALGAYVKWVSDRNLVVVRYNPPTPMPAPTEAPTPVPTPVPTAMPTATPTPTPVPRHIAFIAAALSARNNYNEFASGQKCNQSYLISAAFAPANSRWAGKLDFRQDAYVTNTNVTDILGNQYTGFSTIDGGYAYTPVFLAKQTSLDARLEYQVADPRLYVGLGYLQTTTNYGYPQLHGLGVGVEKLPELRRGLSYYGSAFYYPNASGTYTVASVGSSNYGTSYRQQYQITKLDIGLAYAFHNFPVYIYGGYSGDQYKAKQNAPIGQTHTGPYLGLGVKI